MDVCLHPAIALVRIPEVFIVHSLHEPCGTDLGSGIIYPPAASWAVHLHSLQSSIKADKQFQLVILILAV